MRGFRGVPWLRFGVWGSCGCGSYSSTCLDRHLWETFDAVKIFRAQWYPEFENPLAKHVIPQQTPYCNPANLRNRCRPHVTINVRAQIRGRLLPNSVGSFQEDITPVRPSTSLAWENHAWVGTRLRTTLEKAKAPNPKPRIVGSSFFSIIPILSVLHISLPYIIALGLSLNPKP